MRGDLADAAKPAARGIDLAAQDIVDIGQPQIGKADDAGADFRPAAAPVALLGNPADEFALTDAAKLLRAARAIAGTALDKDRGDDVVAGIDVGQELVKQIAAARMIPDVMMRVDDRQLGFEDILA